MKDVIAATNPRKPRLQRVMGIIHEQCNIKKASVNALAFVIR